MYEIKRRAKTFDTEDSEATREYEAILNDPLCTVISNTINITKDIISDPETGRPIQTTEHIKRTVEWDEKVLF